MLFRTSKTIHKPNTKETHRNKYKEEVYPCRWGRGDTLLVTGRKNEQRKAAGGSRKKKVGAIRGRNPIE